MNALFDVAMHVCMTVCLSVYRTEERVSDMVDEERLLCPASSHV